MGGEALLGGMAVEYITPSSVPDALDAPHGPQSNPGLARDNSPWG